MALLHLDTSALVKLVVAEPESGALAAFLDHHADAVVCTSVVGRVELRVAVARGLEVRAGIVHGDRLLVRGEDRLRGGHRVPFTASRQ